MKLCLFLNFGFKPIICALVFLLGMTIPVFSQTYLNNRSQNPQRMRYKAEKSFSIGLDCNFNAYDLGIGINGTRSLSPIKGLSIYGSLHIRPYHKKVLIESNKHYFYQFYEWRMATSFGLRKDFFLGFEKGVYLMGGAAISMGRFRGTSIKPDIYVLPSVETGGFIHVGRAVLLKAGYNFSLLYREQPHRFTIGLDFNFLSRL
ncbi:MAG: hypothetical protein HQK83_07285 [Fibrobacteria bacterium]|nr:hypothetical protein [Fibrobacteria bacterium]